MTHFEKCPVCEGGMTEHWSGTEKCVQFQTNFRFGCGFSFRPQKVSFQDKNGFICDFESVEDLVRWKKLEAFK
jgi:hypothetical protein